jgi:hypothetical protein
MEQPTMEAPGVAHAMSNPFRHVWFVGGFVAVMGVLSWLLVGDSSPFHDYFIHHVGLPNVWRLLHLPPYLLAAIASGNAHAGGDWAFIMGFILQWSFVGFLLSLLVQRGRALSGAPGRAR